MCILDLTFCEISHEAVGADFSWRASLSAYKLKSPPRVKLPSLHYELVFSLLTLALAHANAATATVTGLGDYERQRHTSETERKRLDEAIRLAADRLCRAAGILQHLSELVIPRWEQAVPSTSMTGRPVETTREMTLALSKLCHADAERLAIRRLLTQAVSEANVAPVQPLPRSHPSPSLLAKLQLNVAALYDDANGLMGSLPSSKQPSDSIRIYCKECSASAHAFAHKWLGIDKGERDAPGEAQAWLSLAREEIKSLSKKANSAYATELRGIDDFLAAYKRINDTVTFQPVPKAADLLASVPGGRAALVVKAYTLPEPRFDATPNGSGLDVDLASLALPKADDEADSSGDEAQGSYAMHSEYY